MQRAKVKFVVMKEAPNFVIQEFVDPVTYSQRGEKSLELIDERIVKLAQVFRDYFKARVTINDWHTGGHYKESGLRTFDTTTGARLSQHKFGRAIDMKIEGYEAEGVRSEIRKNAEYFMAHGLTTIEKDTPGWVHVDCRWTGMDTLLEVPMK